MDRKSISTRLDKNLYKKLQVLAIELDKNANDLLEEGMNLVLEKYAEKVQITNAGG